MSIKEKLVGRRIFQPFFERLHRISLRGMNYGLGGLLESSGEHNLVKWVQEQSAKVDTNRIVFDVGANDGGYAEILISNFTKNDHIYCFEPSRFSFKVLKEKLEHTTNVTLVNSGLGSKKEKRDLYFDEEGSGWASVFERKDTGFNHPLTKHEEIDIISLDQFCQKNKIQEIHFMKLDVEGFELEILKGGERMLPNTHFIQFEFSFANSNSKTYLLEFFDILSDFRIFRVLKDGIYEIKYDPRYEILMTTNYLAINKNVAQNPIKNIS